MISNPHSICYQKLSLSYTSKVRSLTISAATSEAYGILYSFAFRLWFFIIFRWKSLFRFSLLWSLVDRKDLINVLLLSRRFVRLAIMSWSIYWSSPSHLSDDILFSISCWESYIYIYITGQKLAYWLVQVTMNQFYDNSSQPYRKHMVLLHY